jgi:hypothetical protein
LAPDLPWVPVLQGWTYGDYLSHVEQFDRAGVDLRALPVVGVGSVCRRQDTGMVERLLHDLHGMGIRCHGFGFKLGGLRRSVKWLESADSMAWSFAARRRPPPPAAARLRGAQELRELPGLRGEVVRGSDGGGQAW